MPTPVVIGLHIANAPHEDDPTGLPMATQHFGKAIASIEERTFLSGAVVKARFVSAGNNILQFSAITYMKGTGPTQFSVKANTNGRDTRWDNQDAILFLTPLTDGAADFTFADSTTWDYSPSDVPPELANHPTTIALTPTEYKGSLPDGYTLGSNNPVWLPLTSSSATSTGGGRSVQPSTQTEIVVEYDITTGEAKSVSQTTLEDMISWMAGASGGSSGSDVSSGSLGKVSKSGQRNSGSQSSDSPSAQWWDDEDYRNCIRRSMLYIRAVRDREAYSGPKPPLTLTTEIESGIAGATIFDWPRHGAPSFFGSVPAYHTYVVIGPNAHLFNPQITDDDGDKTTGWDYALVTARPLPAGTYTFWHKSYPWTFEPCQFRPPHDETFIEEVIVKSLPRTLLEAFFDPATTTAGVGYLATTSTSTGVLEPAGLSVSGRAITITGLTWQNGRVVLTLDRFGSWLDGFNFIEPAGTVGLRLAEVDATKDWTARTLTWEVSEQPWESGDELMMRMGPIPLPAVRNLTAEANSAGEVVLRWEVAYGAGVSGYRIWRHRPGRDEGPRIYVSDTLSTDTTYTDANSLVPNLTEYRVQAIDRVYNAGESSESVRVGSQ